MLGITNNLTRASSPRSSGAGLCGDASVACHGLWQPLPLEARAPVLEEAPGPALAFVAPQLAKTLLENIGRVEPLVGCQQRLQCCLALQGEVLLARQQRVFLALDVAPLTACKPGILALANRIQGLAQMANDMELVE